MHCRSSEILLEKKIKKIKNVRGVETKINKGIVAIECEKQEEGIAVIEGVIHDLLVTAVSDPQWPVFGKGESVEHLWQHQGVPQGTKIRLKCKSDLPLLNHKNNGVA